MFVDIFPNILYILNINLNRKGKLIMINKKYCNFVKQSKAKQSKAKQSKAKQSKAKQSKAIIIFFIFILFIFNSCSDELITIVDEYNPPYEIKPIPNSDGTVSINFWSGVLANDFAGFNLYATNTSGPFTQPNDAIGYPSLPTIPYDTHTRSNITLTFPTSYTFDTTRPSYITVTAYGTNDLASDGIETRINQVVSVFPRQATTVSGSLNNGASIGGITISITGNTISAKVGVTDMQVKSYGYRTNFNEITVFTNDSLSTSASYSANSGWLYIFYSSTTPTLTKLWITSGGYTYATHSQACNTI